MDGSFSFVSAGRAKGIASRPGAYLSPVDRCGFDKGSITAPEGAKTYLLRPIVLCSFNQLRFAAAVVDLGTRPFGFFRFSATMSHWCARGSLELSPFQGTCAQSRV